MDNMITESIKTDNIDLFKLSFDYEKIKNNLQSEVDLNLLEIESKISYLYMTKMIITPSKNLEFKFLYNPVVFVKKCTKYKANKILEYYIDQIRKHIVNQEPKQF